MIPPPENQPHRGRIFSWTLFDFANTAFSVIVVTVIYSRYFTSHVAGGRRWLWGVAVSLSMIFAAILSPPLGAAADYARSRKKFLLFFTLVCVACTALLYFVEAEMVVLGMLLFILRTSGSKAARVFTTPFFRPSRHAVRTGGSRLTASGGGVSPARSPCSSSSDHAARQRRSRLFFLCAPSFVVAAGFFLVFSSPIFLFVPSPRRERERAGIVHPQRDGGIRQKPSAPLPAKSVSFDFEVSHCVLHLQRRHHHRDRVRGYIRGRDAPHEQCRYRHLFCHRSDDRRARLTCLWRHHR
jgi:hypothetical protein